MAFDNFPRYFDTRMCLPKLKKAYSVIENIFCLKITNPDQCVRASPIIYILVLGTNNYVSRTNSLRGMARMDMELHGVGGNSIAHHLRIAKIICI